MCGSQCGIKGWPTRRNPCVKFAVLRKDGRFDIGRIGSAWLTSVEWNRSGKVGAHPHGQQVDNAATEAKADSAEFTGAIRARFQPRCGGEEIFSHFGAVDLIEKLQTLLVISGIAAGRRQPIGSKRDELGDR